MQLLNDLLTGLLSDAFARCGLDPKYGEVVPSKRPDLCQFQCNGALAAARTVQQNPRAVAQAVVDAIAERDMYFAIVEVAGPGYINLTLADEFMARYTAAIAADARLLCPPAAAPERVVIDFGGPNIAKSMHVGHLRSSVIGDSLQRLIRFVGDSVVSDIHLGDWGTPMGMLICELQRHSPGLVYFNTAYAGPYPDVSPVTIADLEQMYPEAAARCAADPQELQAALEATAELQAGRPGYRALWQHFHDVSVGAMQELFDRLGVHFDLWYGESDVHDRIPALLQRLRAAGGAVLSDGALVVPVAEVDESIPPLLLAKSDGSYLYGTTDLATIEERVEDLRAERVLYVVDKRQSLHFEQLFRAARRTGIAQGAILEHIAFGTVNGPDGKPLKTRQGGVMRLNDLVDMAIDEARKRMNEVGVAEDYAPAEQQEVAEKVALAALKFADLANYRTTNYVFDLEKFTRFEGRTGPYLLYAAVRIKSLLRKAAERDSYPGAFVLPTGVDRDLILQLSRFPDAVRLAYAERAPNHLCEFAFELAQVFSRFYQSCPILLEPDAARRESWLALAQLCLRELEVTLSLLGIDVPERM
jgi:arginyl-tRNA synthetase